MKKAKGIARRWGATLMASLLLAGVLYVESQAIFGVTPLPAEDAARGFMGYVGEHPALMTLPCLEGEAFDETRLPDPALFPCEVTYVYHPTVPAGRVISQSPRGGARRKVSLSRPCVISLTVSMGREMIRMPCLSGMDVREAESILLGLGMRARRVTPGERMGAYAVADTLPRAGTLLGRGQTVTLLVYDTPKASAVTVPDLTGMTAEEAADALAAVGLTRGRVETVAVPDPWGIREGGRVCAQTHAAGDLLPRGYAVGIALDLPTDSSENHMDYPGDGGAEPLSPIHKGVLWNTSKAEALSK